MGVEAEGRIHESVFRKDAGGVGVFEDVEGGFNVRVSIVGVGAEFVAGEVLCTGGQFVGEALAISRLYLYSRKRPSGERLPGVFSPMAIPVNLEEDGGLVPGHAQKVFLHQSFDGVEADV